MLPLPIQIDLLDDPGFYSSLDQGPFERRRLYAEHAMDRSELRLLKATRESNPNDLIRQPLSAAVLRHRW